MTPTTKTAWNLAFDIKEAKRREEELTRQMQLIKDSLSEIRAGRAKDEAALCEKLKKSGGVMVAHELCFWTPTGKHLEVAPSHNPFKVEDLCAPQPPPAELDEPESFADACVAEMSAV